MCIRDRPSTPHPTSSSPARHAQTSSSSTTRRPPAHSPLLFAHQISQIHLCRNSRTILNRCPAGRIPCRSAQSRVDQQPRNLEMSKCARMVQRRIPRRVRREQEWVQHAPRCLGSTTIRFCAFVYVVGDVEGWWECGARQGEEEGD